MSQPRLFISYRRADTEGYAGRIFDQLERKLEANEIFIDVDAIDAGQDFQQSVREAIEASYAVLVLVGDRWLAQQADDGSRRIDDPDDPVRKEVEMALGSRTQIIPVLCGNASMPGPDDLPPSIARFSYLNAVRITSGRFRQEMSDLEGAVDLARHRSVGAAESDPRFSAALHSPERSEPLLIAGGTRRPGLGDRVSSGDLGSYRYDDVAQYEGLFEMVRPDFSEKDQLHCYAMRIAWDVELKALVIKHKGIEGSVYQQFGVIAFARNEKYLSIDAGNVGWRQLAILERMDFRRTMFGALFTLGNVTRRVFVPTISPIVLTGYEGEERDTRRIVAGDADYEFLASRLAEARAACINLV